MYRKQSPDNPNKADGVLAVQEIKVQQKCNVNRRFLIYNTWDTEFRDGSGAVLKIILSLDICRQQGAVRDSV